jgi:hypothetical protein
LICYAELRTDKLKHIGHFTDTIISKIGAGGMGEVVALVTD